MKEYNQMGPTPWVFYRDGDSAGINDADGENVCDDMNYYPSAPNEVEMKHIVKCVNSHDALLAACEKALAVLGPQNVETRQMLRAAIAATKEVT